MMIRRFSRDAGPLMYLGLLGIPTPAVAQNPDGVRRIIAPEPAGNYRRAESARIVLLTRDDVVTDSTLTAFVERLEGSAIRVRTILGNHRAPDVRLVVILDGPGRRPDGSTSVPHVDGRGRVFLYYYSPSGQDYLVSAGHEIVHAYRRAAGTRYTGFVEEGLAQAVTLQLEPNRLGFPRYGVSIPVAAGHLVARDEALPLRTVWRENRSLTRRCAIESYLLRESFFEYLTRRFSLSEIIAFAYSATGVRETEWTEAFGVSFDDLTTGWRTDLLAAYHAVADHEEQADRYRSSRSVRFQAFCDP